MKPSSREDLRLPNSLKETIVRVHGEKGSRWLANLPALLAECGERWSLELACPFDNLSYNLVIPGRNAQGVELSIAVALHIEFMHGI
jgi:hypothetical protein